MAISADANQKTIRNKAPADYLPLIQNHPRVQFDDPDMDRTLQTHLIDPTLLRANDFAAFYDDRRARLLALVQPVTGKAF